MPPLESQEPGLLYEIRVEGRLDDGWAEWLEGMMVSSWTGSGPTITTLSGRVADQSALYGLLGRVRNLGLTLISVDRIQPSSVEDGPRRGSSRERTRHSDSAGQEEGQ